MADLLVAVLAQPATAAADLLRHLGPAHGFERFLVFVVAFGPFVVLAVVAVVVRRREAREQENPRPEA